MQVSHTPFRTVSCRSTSRISSASAGLVPMMELAPRPACTSWREGRLSVPTDKGANAGAKIAALVAGMFAGADSIDDMAVLRHGG